MSLNVPSICLKHTWSEVYRLTVTILVTALYMSFLMAIHASCVTESLHSSVQSTVSHSVQHILNICYGIFYWSWKVRAKKHLSVSGLLLCDFFFFFWHNFTLTQLKNLHHFLFYTVIFSFMQFSIEDPWLHLSSVGAYQKVTSLSRFQSHVWIMLVM